MSSPETPDSKLPKVAWDSSIDTLLSKWCDEAKCFEWMHTEAYALYQTRARIFVIVSNILSALSGLSNIIAGGETIDGFQLAWIFGSLTIIVSMTNMLQEKLAYASMATEFQHFSVAWGVVRRKLEEQLALPPQSRKDCATFMKYIRQDINQVSIEGNAKIPDFIRNACYLKFSKIHNFDIPDICGQMEHTKTYQALGDSITIPLLVDR
jgi:hypothetical protein